MHHSLGDASIKLLDLFCGAGGAAKGYANAGFEVIGLDINPQPNYPYEFIQMDVFDTWWGVFDAVHASPPCQAYSSLRMLGKQEGKNHPAYIDVVRYRLQLLGVPYVIENVVGAPLRDPVVLCGQYFGLGVRRHRLFETNWPLIQPDCKPYHKKYPIAVYGDHPERDSRSPGTGGRINRAHTLAMGREAMGIDWMNWKELTQSIPPAYTEYIGRQLMLQLTNVYTEKQEGSPSRTLI